MSGFYRRHFYIAVLKTVDFTIMLYVFPFVPCDLGVMSLCYHETHTHTKCQYSVLHFLNKLHFILSTNVSIMLALSDKASVKAYALYLTIYSVLKVFVNSQTLEKQQQIQKCQLHSAIAKLKQCHWNEVFWTEGERDSSKPTSIVWLFRAPFYTGSHSKAHSSKTTLGRKGWQKENTVISQL